MSQLFVILVHYGEAAPTLDALAAIQKGSLVPHHIIVIDHAEKPLQLTAPRNLSLIRPTENGGYGAGVNMGLGVLKAKGAKISDLVVVMNNDVEVSSDSLENLVAWWQVHTKPALVGVVTQEGNQTIYGGGHINYWTGRAQLNREPGVPLHYIHGAFFAAPYEVLLTLHGLPEDYFLYWEDVLLGRRARQRGVPLQVATTVTVRHRATDTAPTPQQLFYLVRNGALFMERELAWPGRLIWRLLNRARLVYHRRHGVESAVVQRALQAAARGEVGKHAYDV